MATRPETVEHLLDLMAEAGQMRAQKMFGEYAIYRGGKLVALVCDGELFMKRTAGGKVLVAEAPEGAIAEAQPYKGAKPCWRIDADQCEDRDWLVRLVTTTARELPEPKPKKAKLIKH